MNYGQLKSRLVELGFSDEAELEEFGGIVPDSLNHAITEINLNVVPNIGTYEFEQDGTDDEILYYDIEELTTEDGVIKFLEFADTPIMIGTQVYKKFNNFEIENDKTIVMDGTIQGHFKVFYKKAHVPFTVDTPDDTEIELPLKAHYLVPLLTSYYVWLEDEKSKAVDYYNQYERLMNELIQRRQKARCTIMNGGI